MENQLFLQLNVDMVNFKGGWEFPGGKIEDRRNATESIEDVKSWKNLIRKLSVGELIDTIEYDYPDFHLSMDCFWCEIVKGDLVLKEQEDAR